MVPLIEYHSRLARTSWLVADQSVNGSVRYSLLETVKNYARQKVATRGAVGITGLRDRRAAFYGAWGLSNWCRTLGLSGPSQRHLA